MRIPNPFFHRYKNRTRFNWNGGSSVSTTTESEVDVPEGAVDCMIEPTDDWGEAIGPGFMWSPKTGVVDMEGYAKTMQIEKEREELEAEKKQMANKKAKEARERKPKKVVEVEKTTGPKIRLDDDLDMGKKLEL